MSKMIFQSAEHQSLFEKQGFIVLDFLNENEVNELNQIFDELHPDFNKSGFYSGSYSADKNYKKSASQEIVRVFSRSYEKYFKDYTPFGGAFLFKVPGVNSDLAMHQDWTIVDEEEHVALNCWIPLNDIHENNGALHIVPGSHYGGYKTLRAPTLPFFFTGNDQLVEQAAIPMYVKAGQAVILNQSVIHFSTPNISTEVRKAITAGVKSKDAQMYFHYKVPEKDELEVFEMDDDFLISFNNFFEDIGKRPYLGKSIGFIPYKNPILEQENLKLTIEQLTLESGFPYKFEQGNTNFFKNIYQKLFS
jgi:hypothetical protein